MSRTWSSCSAILPLVLALNGGDADGREVRGDPPLASPSDYEIEQLRALGYVEFSPEPANPKQSGVMYFDKAGAAPGDNLVVSSPECAAHLIDLAGNVLHTWKQESCRYWWSATLLHNGDLVVNGSLGIDSEKSTAESSKGESVKGKRKKGRKRRTRRDQAGRFTARIAWSGDRVWLREMQSHHLIDWTPSGEILLLTAAPIPIEDVRKNMPGLPLLSEDGAPISEFHDSVLNWLNEKGELLGALSLFEAVTKGERKFDFVDPRNIIESSTHAGVFHANSAFAMDQSHLAGTDPLYARENVLVASRNQNRIFIVNRRSRSLVWEWGVSKLAGPHDATWLANGNILVFDNGIDTERKHGPTSRNSRVLEIDPRRNKVIWKYPDGVGTEFRTSARGMAQRLENGNTLILNSQSGEAFEVTGKGELMWHYFNPFLPGNKHRPALTAIKRYPKSWVRPLE